MPGFDFVCPMNYPNRCNLDQGEVDFLLKDEGKKIGFFMYQFKKQDKYLRQTVKSYFEPRDCRILDAQDLPDYGVKVCKICRMATASHFGIAVLTPQNKNVNLEIGLVWGQGKPILFLANPTLLKEKTLEKLAFDLSSHLVIEYRSKKELIEKIERDARPFLDKVRVMGIYQQELVNSVRDKLKKLRESDPDNIEFLKMILLMGRDEFGSRLLDTYIRIALGEQHKFRHNVNARNYMGHLGGYGFVEIDDFARQKGLGENYRYQMSQALLPILRQEAFKEIE